MNVSQIGLILFVKNVSKQSVRDLSDGLGGNLAARFLLSVFKCSMLKDGSEIRSDNNSH